MQEVSKAITARQINQQEQIDLQKGGKPLPIGTIKKRPNGNFIKTASGWKYHSKHSSHQKEPAKDTMRDVLDDPKAKKLIESIEEYASDLKDGPRVEHIEGLRDAVKRLEQSTGFKYDTKEIEARFKQQVSDKLKGKHIADMTTGEKRMVGAAMQIENVQNLSDSQLHQLIVESNIRNQVTNFTQNKEK